MHLALSHPLEVHQLKDRFLWPSMDAEIQAFCRRFPQSQRTEPQKPDQVPLSLLPIISVPFERIGMDLIRLLPKSAQNHKYILVIMKYATEYAEALPLPKATPHNIAKERMILFSHVRIPKDILTDQGMPFMSKLMVFLCRLLQVKHLRTSISHPQTDGLVERLNQTLKTMLRWVVNKDGTNWDLLPYMLFAI